MKQYSMPVLIGCWALGLTVTIAAPTPTVAQDVPARVSERVHSSPRHRWGHLSQPVFPRTYSYQYDPWFNRPRHTRHVMPDGKIVWTTTVRGLPLGTPWPSY